MELLHYITVSDPQLREPLSSLPPWQIPGELSPLISQIIPTLNSGYRITAGQAVHETADIHPTAILQGPLIIGRGCRIGPHSLIRGGAILGEDVTIGGCCEIKSAVILNRSAIAHLNYVGDSLIGEEVNLEAGVVVANHYNERADKRISLFIEGRRIETEVVKFGAIIGDGSRIGANAVTSPGTVLTRNSVVARLALVDQRPPLPS